MRQLFIAILMLSLSFFSDYSEANENLLQTKKRDHKWMQMLSELDLNSQQVTLDYKVGTTSVGLKIIKENDYIAYWYPEGNISAQSEGQVVTYYLGRFFDMSEIVTPSEYFQISGKSIQTLIDFLKNDTEDKEDIWKQKSITDVLFSAQQSLKNNTPMNGVIALKMSNFEPYELVDYENNRFNVNHEIAKMIRADQKQPSSIKILNLPDFYPEEPVINTSTELDLARELSKIMVLDMLMGQLDRFSGGNLEARFDEDNENPQMGRFHFLIRDNGAAYLSNGGPEDREFEKYKSYVTRFDRKQIQKISLLLELIDKNPQELKRTLKMKSDVTLLQERAKAVLAHVEKQIQLYGEEKVFFISL